MLSILYYTQVKMSRGKCLPERFSFRKSLGYSVEYHLVVVFVDNQTKRGDIMECIPCIPLIEILAEIPDFRKAKGKRHPLPAILALACVAVMCGCRGYRAVAEWGRNYDRRLAEALGFTHEKTPCASTLRTIFGNISVKLRS